MRDNVLIAPGLALDANVLSNTPVLELAGGRLEVVESKTLADTIPLRQTVNAIVPVPILGIVLIDTDEELYMLPLTALTISVENRED